MSSIHSKTAGDDIRPIPKANEWEMMSSFVLNLLVEKKGANDCLLAPIEQALKPFGLAEDRLCEISYEVEHMGEEMRRNCPEGKLECVNVRVYASLLMLRKSAPPSEAPLYFINKQIASSESDNLDQMEHPCCYIDLYVY